MNRLNFAQMVSNNLNDQQDIKFFKSSGNEIEKFYKPRKYAANVEEAREVLNLDGKIKYLVSSVHEKLRERQLLGNSKRAKSKTKGKLQKPLDSVTEKPTEKNKNSVENLELENLSLPRMKVLLNDAHQKFIECSDATRSNYETHKRLVAAVLRQSEMQDMIDKHKLIKYDRQSLAYDIYALRHVLDDCQHRVNNSIKELSNHKTYCTCHNLNCEKKL